LKTCLAYWESLKNKPRCFTVAGWDIAKIQIAKVPVTVNGELVLLLARKHAKLHTNPDKPRQSRRQREWCFSAALPSYSLVVYLALHIGLELGHTSKAKCRPVFIKFPGWILLQVVECMPTQTIPWKLLIKNLTIIGNIFQLGRGSTGRFK
jgi:hypothetical protein